MAHKEVPNVWSYTLVEVRSNTVGLPDKIDENGLIMSRIGYSYSVKLQMEELKLNIHISAFEATMIIPLEEIICVLDSKKDNELIEASCFEDIMESYIFCDIHRLKDGNYVKSIIDGELSKSETILANLLSTLGILEPYSMGSSYYRKKINNSCAPEDNTFLTLTPNGAFYDSYVEYIG